MRKKILLVLLSLLLFVGCTHQKQTITFVGESNNWKAKFIYSYEMLSNKPSENSVNEELLLFYKGDSNPQNVKFTISSSLLSLSDESEMIQRGKWVSCTKAGGKNVALLSKSDTLELIIEWNGGKEEILLSPQ